MVHNSRLQARAAIEKLYLMSKEQEVHTLPVFCTPCHIKAFYQQSESALCFLYWENLLFSDLLGFMYLNDASAW